ncbi:MAG: sigma 54-interacting transcriptional regulator [Spirochaetales bacterium]|nr:sigma 54-interacting transcriptional regulator [Spirochaetales bacterium]
MSVSTTHIYGSDPQVIEPLQADIIIARGITAHAIAEQKKTVHVVPIAMSSADLLDALALAKEGESSAHIGIITHEHLCDEQTIATLVGCPVSVFQVTDQNDVRAGVDQLTRAGCSVLVGGLTMCRLCEERGLKFVHIKTGYQAVVHAVAEAVAAARSLDRAQTRGNLLLTLLNNATYALLAIDSNGKIIAGNRQAENLFGKSPLEGLPMEQVYFSSRWAEVMREGKQKDELVGINGQQFLVTHQPIRVDEETFGFLYTFQNAEAIRQTEHKIRTELNRKGLVARYSFSDIVTQNAHMVSLVEKAKRFSQVPGAVLLLGETGTGKELFAQSIHNASSRAKEPFVAVNCAALPEQLLESELFGYTEGAFTGASKGGKSGLFELAHKGTIFLDEIAEMPIVVQAKLLRVLQEREVRKIGADMVVPVDVRVISAANNNILEKVKEGKFRLDLFYRISLLSLLLVPLRERVEDIGIIFKHFVQQYCNRHGLSEPYITDEAVAELTRFSWPGNIRELRNAAERLAILHTSDVVTVKEIELLDIGSTSLRLDEGPSVKPMKIRNSYSDEELYQQYLHSGLSREVFARQVGLSRTTLWRKFAQFMH